jgi:hypothetical protein
MVWSGFESIRPMQKSRAVPCFRRLVTPNSTCDAQRHYMHCSSYFFWLLISFSAYFPIAFFLAWAVWLSSIRTCFFPSNKTVRISNAFSSFHRKLHVSHTMTMFEINLCVKWNTYESRFSNVSLHMLGLSRHYVDGSKVQFDFDSSMSPRERRLWKVCGWHMCLKLQYIVQHLGWRRSVDWRWRFVPRWCRKVIPIFTLERWKSVVVYCSACEGGKAVGR